MNSLQRLLLNVGCGLAFCMPAAAQHAVSLNIQAQPLADALASFAQQTGLQMIVSSEVAKDVMAPRVSGAYTAEDALKELLSKSTLQYHFINARTVTIQSSKPTSGGAEGVSANAWVQDHLAQAGNPASGSGQSVGKENESGSYGASSIRKEDTISEVIVTAQKREERLIDVPISIATLSGEELKDRGVISLLDLPSVVPDLAISYTGAAVTMEVRGISNTLGSASLVGMYLDEADVTLAGSGTQINPSAYDLERVEVLRGPQGTLYGEGSAGGTIRFITKKPNLNRWDFDMDVAAMFTQDGAPSQRINAVVNVPQIDNQLGMRIAGTFDHEGGWIDQPAADQTNINRQDLTNVRVKELWQPNSNFTASAMVVINRDERGFNITDQSSARNFTQVFNLTTTPRLKSNYELYNLTLSYDLSPIRILSTTSYLNSKAPMWNQGYSYQLNPPDTPPFNFYEPIQKIADRLLTQEVRLTNSSDASPWQWTLGAFYRNSKDSSVGPLNYEALPGPLPPDSLYSFAVKTQYKSWSAFADTSYRLWDRLTVGAGVRYFRETQDYLQDFGAGLTEQNATFNSVDPRFYVQYKLTNSFNIYTSAAKGFRSGGFNGLDEPPYEPESVWTYELGAKMALMEGRLSFNAAVFRSDYSNFQSYGLVPDTHFAYVFGVGRARVKGIEWDSSWRPSAQWSLSFHGDYLNDEFTQINAMQAAYVVGDSLDLVPRYQFTLSGERDFSWSGRPGFIRLDYSQQGPETTRNRYVNGTSAGPTPWYYGESEVVHMLNFRTSVRANDNLRFGFFVQNVLNEQHFVNPYAYTQAAGVRSRPRTYGIEFGVGFD